MKREAKIPSKSIKIIEGILLKSMLGPSLSFQIWRSSWTWHVNLLTWKHQKMIMFMFISIMIESSLILTRNWSCSVKFDLLGPAWEYKIICMCFFEKFHSSSCTFKLFKNLHVGWRAELVLFLFFFSFQGVKEFLKKYKHKILSVKTNNISSINSYFNHHHGGQKCKAMFFFWAEKPNF
jgi:hypothetical protein